LFEYNERTEKCSYCGEEIALNTRRCPYCGSLLEIERNRRIKDDTFKSADSAGIEFNKVEVSGSQNFNENIPIDEENNTEASGVDENKYMPDFQLINYVKPERENVNATRQPLNEASQSFNSTVNNSRPVESGSDNNLGNGLKVFLTIFCTVIPGLGQLVGVIVGAIFLASDDADKRSFGRAILIASLIFFVISFFIFFLIIVLLSSIGNYIQ